MPNLEALTGFRRNIIDFTLVDLCMRWTIAHALDHSRNRLLFTC